MADQMVRLSIGRAESCDIRVDDEYVSPVHAVLVLHEDARMTVEDCGSTNGTYLRGVRVYAPTPVRPTDQIRIGHTMLQVMDLLAAAARMVPRG